MRDRTNDFLNQISTSTYNVSDQRPTLILADYQSASSFRVDMEHFFEFTFSFAEALADLEDKHCGKGSVAERSSRRLAREAAIEANLNQGSCDFDIDARWM